MRENGLGVRAGIREVLPAAWSPVLWWAGVGEMCERRACALAAGVMMPG